MGTEAGRRVGRALLGAALLYLAGCCSEQCDPERLPNRGRADTPETLATIVQHEARNECWSALYDLLSERTRNEHGRTKWRIGVSSIRVPAPYEYRVVDVMERGTWVAAIPTSPNEAIAYYDYQEPGKKLLKLRLLLLREGGEWRVGLVDQDERIRAGRPASWWFDE